MPTHVGIIVNGGQVVKPSVLPLIDTTAMVPVSPVPAPPPLMIGVSDGGDPSRVYEFRSFQEALAVLKGGRILSYLARVFNPSGDKTNVPGAPVIKFIRVSSTATQGSAAIVSAPADPPRWVEINMGGPF
jgi:hypothetical protein